MNKVQIERLKTLADDNFSPIALRLPIYGLSYRIRFDVVINMLIGMAVTQIKSFLTLIAYLGDDLHIRCFNQLNVQLN